VDVTEAIRSGVAHILSGNEGNKGAGSKDDDCLAIELEIDADSAVLLSFLEYRMGGDVHDRGSRIQWMEGSAGQGREWLAV
jgi:hypothetical protein